MIDINYEFKNMLLHIISCEDQVILTRMKDDLQKNRLTRIFNNIAKKYPSKCIKTKITWFVTCLICILQM